MRIRHGQAAGRSQSLASLIILRKRHAGNPGSHDRREFRDYNMRLSRAGHLVPVDRNSANLFMDLDRDAVESHN